MAFLDITGLTQEQIAQVQRELGQVTLPQSHDTWTLLRIPKSVFQLSGGGAGSWATVAAVRLTAQANSLGQVAVYWDDLKLQGGSGLQGTYKYQVVYFNSTTGTRSNPNPAPVVVRNVARQAVSLANLPVSADSQVDKLEIYRTVGNGVFKFRVLTVDNGTTTVLDTVADFAGLDSRSGANLMSSQQLQLDNVRPNDKWDDVAGPFAGRLWSCRSPNVKAKGRVFMSAAGRAESAPEWLDITSDDEPTQKVVVWNSALWCWTTQRVFQIIGTSPFVPREVFGAPGTNWPHSIVPTPVGVAYLAHDGVRLFDGTQSRLVTPEAVQLLFKGEALEGVPAFPAGTDTAVVGTYRL